MMERKQDRGDSWVGYWNDPGMMRGGLWDAHALFFVRRFIELCHPEREDVVVDIGGGNGLIGAGLAPHVGEVHVADTSSVHIDLARRRYDSVANLHFHHLPEDAYLDFSRIPVQRVHWVLCVSVVQYYRSLEDVARLLEEIQRMSGGGCRVLLADLPLGTSMVRDLWGSLLGALRSRTLGLKLKELQRRGVADYKRLRQQLGLLQPDMEDINTLCARFGTTATLLDGQMTLNSNRKHILIQLDD